MGTYDERIKDYRGKKKVLGRIAGQMASMTFALLKTDQETLSRVPPGRLHRRPCSMTQRSTGSIKKASIAR